MLLKLLAVAVGTFFTMVALLVIRFEMLVRKHKSEQALAMWR